MRFERLPYRGREMKSLPWLVLFLTVYASSYLLFASIRRDIGNIKPGHFLNLNFMATTPQRRRPFVFSMKPWRINSELPRSPNLDVHAPDLRWSVIVFVKSHSSHHSRRMLARMAWGSFEFIDGVRIEYVFVIGKPESGEDKTRIEYENEKFGDLLQINLEEKYTSVGFKTLASMQYAAANFPPEWMYVSCDDDIAPDWTRLIKEFDAARNVATIRHTGDRTCNLDDHVPITCGFGCVVESIPHRKQESKWYIQNRDYPLPVYPTYCMGGFYGMSVKLASELYEISRTLPFFWIDDVWITGFLRLKRFLPRDSPCQTDVNVGLSSTSEEAFSSTGSVHELLIHWKEYASKIFEKKYIYVNERPGDVHDTVLFEWEAWLEYLSHELPVL